MAEEIVDEGVSGSRKRQQVRTQLFESQEEKDEAQDIPSNSGEEEDDENDVHDIWESWKILLKSLRDFTVLPALR